MKNNLGVIFLKLILINGLLKNQGKGFFFNSKILYQ